MAQEGRIDEFREGTTSPKGGKSRWQPSRGFRIGLAGLVFSTVVLVAAGIAAASQGDSAPASIAPTATLAPEKDNDRPARPRDSFVQEPAGDSAGSPASSVTASQAGALTGAQAEGISSEGVSGAASPTPTVGEGAFATPAASTPDPVPQLADMAVALVAEIEASNGIDVYIEGQDWGADEDDQVKNLEAIQAALAALPESVLAEVRAGSGGVLTILSNEHGRTLAGWQPYGDRAANYYTNEDQGAGGRHPSNQVVLQPGSSAHTIAHEMLHAYQLRDTTPGAFVSALLTDEMKSFMAATGWTQLAGDGEVLSTGGNSWEGINQLFDYDGPALLYTNQFGGITELYAPNPLEAFAEAAALYYTNDSTWPLPGWDALWSWFDANLG